MRLALLTIVPLLRVFYAPAHRGARTGYGQ